MNEMSFVAAERSFAARICGNVSAAPKTLAEPKRSISRRGRPSQKACGMLILHHSDLHVLVPEQSAGTTAGGLAPLTPSPSPPRSGEGRSLPTGHWIVAGAKLPFG